MNPRNESKSHRKFPFETNLEGFQQKFETNPTKTSADFSYRNESTHFTPCAATKKIPGLENTFL
jgi:hypothetical protein